MGKKYIDVKDEEDIKMEKAKERRNKKRKAGIKHTSQNIKQGVVGIWHIIQWLQQFILAVSLTVLPAYAGLKAYQSTFAMQYAREAVLFCSLYVAVYGSLLLGKLVVHASRKES